MSAVKLGFVLLSNRRKPFASTRVSVLNMLPFLAAADFDPIMSYEPGEAAEEPDVTGLADRMCRQKVEIAYFQKVHGASVLAEIRKLSAAGIKTVYGVCDLIDNEMAGAADATVVVTEYLKSLYDARLHHKIHVVHDGIENAALRKTSWQSTLRGDSKGDRIKAILVTSSQFHEMPVIRIPPGFVDVTVVGHYPRAATLALRAKALYWQFLALQDMGDRAVFLKRYFRKGFRAVNWSLDTAYDEMIGADIGIIPVDMRPDRLPGQHVSWWQVKSENRLTMKMSLGLPVIASPVPAYLDLIKQGQNGFIAENRGEWLQYMNELRDPRLRQSIGERARESVIGRFSMDQQARRLVDVLQRTLGTGASAAR